ncbi:hypothetical protein V8G54_005102 [Vigna mungo]|uniref:Uncharacterized protein n=1 Tax=Vigna mungo TaxID=3915 RepID=A0AAQ3PIY2_VIGMU
MTLASPSKVAKVVVFSGNRVVGCGGNVKTVKKGEELLRLGGKAVVSKINPVESVYRAREDLLQDVKKGKKHSGGGENSSNWEQKEEDAINNNGARKGEETLVFSWVKREKFTTYEGIDIQVKGNRRSILCESWIAVTQMGRVEILHESLQVDRAVAKSVVATRADEVRVEILRISQNWAKII